MEATMAIAKAFANLPKVCRSAPTSSTSPSMYAGIGELPELLIAFEHLKKASGKAEVVKLITEHDSPREAIPTLWLEELDVVGSDTTVLAVIADFIRG
jgi:hypothetical protein